MIFEVPEYRVVDAGGGGSVPKPRPHYVDHKQAIKQKASVGEPRLTPNSCQPMKTGWHLKHLLFVRIVFAFVSGSYSGAVRRLFSGGVLYVGVYAWRV